MKSKIIQHCVSSNVRKKALSEPTTTLKIILEYGKTPSRKPRFKQLGLRNMIPTMYIDAMRHIQRHHEPELLRQTTDHHGMNRNKEFVAVVKPI